MKKSIFTLAMLVMCLAASAQISFNAKAGMNMSKMSNADGSKMKIGYHVGVGMDYAFAKMWSVQPSLLLTAKGVRFSEGSASATINPVYLELPIMAAFRLPLSENVNFIVNAGPYFAFGIAGKSTLKAGGDKESSDVFGDKGLMNRFDAGIGVGVGTEICKHFLINLNGEFGLANVAKESDTSSKNMNISLGVGYKF